MTGPICVIVPAFNAADTIGLTIKSALAEREVGAVVVVDDASGDATVAAARAADDGSGRLTVLCQHINQGPSAARNRAIEASDLPLLAIVDSDDRIVPGRFSRMLGVARGWDFIADNIAFVPQDAADEALALPRQGEDCAAARRIGLEEFVLGNISDPARPRAELGFLKPLFRRDFLDHHQLRYDTALRLGEDFVLYAKALLSGACFLVRAECGYIACQRETSLSGSHRTSDLEALYTACGQLCADAAASGIAGGTLAVLERHRAALFDKLAVRRLLDSARENGRARAILGELHQPAQLMRSTLDLRRSRLSPANTPIPRYRMMLGPEFFRN